LLRGTVVHRPSFDSSRSRAYGRNLALDLLVAVGVGVTLAVVTSLLPTIARRGGLEPIGLAALGAAPFVANLLGAFAGRFGPRTPAQLSVIRGLGAVALVGVLLVPVPPVMIGVAVVYWMSLSFGGPLHLRLWGVMYPARVRGRVLGFSGMCRAAATAIAALAGGVLADRFGGPPVIALAGLVGVGCAVGYALFRTESAGRPAVFSARQAVHALRERPVLSRLAVAQGFYGGGLIAAAPLFALVNVDRLELSLGMVGVIGILQALATTVAFPIWGAVTDRHGGLVGMRIGGVLGVLSLVGYALAPDVSVLFVAAVLGGVAGASIDVGIGAVVSDQTTLADRSAAMAGWNALTGARGIVAAFLMSALVQIGLVDVSTGLLLCAAASLVGVGLFMRTGPGVPVETRAWEIQAGASRPGGAIKAT
jgi:MFS family permease